jgi:hypothetical protein
MAEIAPLRGRLLTAAAFRGWPTRRAYETALKNFMRFTAIERPDYFGP